MPLCGRWLVDVCCWETNSGRRPVLDIKIPGAGIPLPLFNAPAEGCGRLRIPCPRASRLSPMTSSQRRGIVLGKWSAVHGKRTVLCALARAVQGDRASEAAARVGPMPSGANGLCQRQTRGRFASPFSRFCVSRTFWGYKSANVEFYLWHVTGRCRWPQPARMIPLPSSCRWIVPCDLVILSGTCIMDESGLTGESMPQQKLAVPDDEPGHAFDYQKAGKKYTLFAGTTCLRSADGDDPATGLVLTTGMGTSKVVSAPRVVCVCGCFAQAAGPASPHHRKAPSACHELFS